MAVYEALLLNTAVPQIQAAQAGDSYVMVVNATTPALRITQTGTGDSILVEDAANPDSSPFVVTAAGDVGIGTASPTFKLQVIGTSQLSLSAAGTQQALQLNNSDTTAGTQAVKLGFSSAGVTKASINAAVYGNDYMTFNVGSDIERARITSTGTLNIVGAGTAGSTQAISFNGSTPVDTLVTTSGGLVGIGTSSPSTYNAKLVSYGSFGTSTPAFSLVNASAENASNIAESQYWLANSFSGLVNVAKIGAISGTTGNQYGSLYFSTSNAGAPTERMRLDASGNLGLGVTPSAWNTAGSTKAIQFANDLGAGALAGWFGSANLLNNAIFSATGGGTMRYVVNGTATQYQQASGAHAWLTAPSGTADTAITFIQAMTLDASGNLGVGQTNPSAWLVNGIGVGSGTSDWGATIYTGTSSSGYLCFADGTSSTDRYRGYLQYSHATDAMVFATAATERARITSGGDFVVTRGTGGDTTVGATLYANGTVTCARSSSIDADLNLYVYSTGAAAARFYVGMGGTVYATNTTISAISDQRFKENIRDLDVGLNSIMALKPRLFDWKAGKGKNKKDDRGFIAQEIEQVFPDLVDQWADPAPEGEEPYKSVRQDLIPVLVKAIQEQQAMINELKAKVAALQGA